MRTINRFNPLVSKIVLLFIAGLVWIAVGSMLLIVAFSWLSAAPGVHDFFLAGAGVFVALLVHHLGFLRIVDKNVKRILALGEKTSVFAFVPWKSYLIITVMIITGVILRHSAIPKHYLAVVYIGMGLALILSSVRYMRILFQESKKQKQA